MDLISPPSVDYRAACPTLGIRVIVPFRGMLAVRDQLWSELFAWLDARGIVDVGSAFLRLNVIDMQGMMDMEAGVMTSSTIEADDRVRPGEMPAGLYATLTYRDHSMRANKMLLGWVAENNIRLAKGESDAGDVFDCRYELVTSDIRTERRKTKWVVQLNMLVDGPPPI